MPDPKSSTSSPATSPAKAETKSPAPAPDPATSPPPPGAAPPPPVSPVAARSAALLTEIRRMASPSSTAAAQVAAQWHSTAWRVLIQERDWVGVLALIDALSTANNRPLVPADATALAEAAETWAATYPLSQSGPNVVLSPIPRT